MVKRKKRILVNGKAVIISSPAIATVVNIDTSSPDGVTPRNVVTPLTLCGQKHSEADHLTDTGLTL
jgi:hypothetical protein